MSEVFIAFEVKNRGRLVPVEWVAGLCLLGYDNFPALKPAVYLAHKSDNGDSDNLITFHSAWELVQREILTNSEIDDDVFKNLGKFVLRQDTHQAIKSLEPALQVVAQKLRVVIEGEELVWRAYLGLQNSQTMFEGKFDPEFDYSILTPT